MSLSALRSVGDAVDATREFLMPVSARRWGVLAMIVAFLGTAGTPVPANPQFFDPRLWRGPEGSPGVVPEDGEVDVPPPGAIELPSVFDLSPRLLALVAIVLAVAVAYVALGVLMRFVFVEALRTRRVAVVAPIRRYFRGTLGVIGFRAILWAITTLLILLGAVAVTDLGPGPLGPSAGAIVAALAAAAAAIVWIVDAITLQFVIPVMVRGDVGVLSGWRRLWSTLVEEWVEYFLFGIVRLAVGIAVGIVAALAVIVVLVAVGIVLGTFAGIVILLSGGFGALSESALAVLTGLAVLFLLTAVVAFALVNVPFQVYLWYYALLVLGDTDSDLDLIPELRASVREEDASNAHGA